MINNGENKIEIFEWTSVEEKGLEPPYHDPGYVVDVLSSDSSEELETKIMEVREAWKKR